MATQGWTAGYDPRGSDAPGRGRPWRDWEHDAGIPGLKAFPPAGTETAINTEGLSAAGKRDFKDYKINSGNERFIFQGLSPLMGRPWQLNDPVWQKKFSEGVRSFITANPKYAQQTIESLSDPKSEMIRQLIGHSGHHTPTGIAGFGKGLLNVVTTLGPMALAGFGGAATSAASAASGGAAGAAGGPLSAIGGTAIAPLSAGISEGALGLGTAAANTLIPTGESLASFSPGWASSPSFLSSLGSAASTIPRSVLNQITSLGLRTLADTSRDLALRTRNVSNIQNRSQYNPSILFGSILNRQNAGNSYALNSLDKAGLLPEGVSNPMNPWNSDRFQVPANYSRPAQITNLTNPLGNFQDRFALRNNPSLINSSMTSNAIKNFNTSGLAQSSGISW